VQQRVDGIQPGWTPSQLESYLQTYFQELVQAPATEILHAEYRSLLNKKLKPAGYTPLSITQWKTMVSDAVATKGHQQHGGTGTGPVAAKVFDSGPHRPDRYQALNLPGVTVADWDGNVVEAPGKPRRTGILDTDTQLLLCNFTLLLPEEIEVEDELEGRKDFLGTINLHGVEREIRIDADVFADRRQTPPRRHHPRRRAGGAVLRPGRPAPDGGQRPEREGGYQVAQGDHQQRLDGRQM
jgi:hypothetical protein